MSINILDSNTSRISQIENAPLQGHLPSANPLFTSSILSMQQRREADTACEEACEAGCTATGNFLYRAFEIIYDILSWPFVALSDWIDSYYNPEQVEPAVLEIARHYRIARERISDVPTKIDLEALLETSEGIEVTELLGCFDRLIGPDPDISPNEKRTLREGLNSYVNNIQNRSLFSDQARLDLHTVVKSIIVNLNKPDLEIALTKKIHSLRELSDAGTHCPPRHYEEGLRQLKFLKCDDDSIEEVVLLTLQVMKEDIILSLQEGEFHILNHARKKVGREWGLDVENASLAQDEFVWILGLFIGYNASVYNSLLRRNYTPARMIATIYEHLKMEARPALMNDFLYQEYSEGRISDEFDFDSVFENDNRTISREGVAFLLERLHFLNRI